MLTLPDYGLYVFLFSVGSALGLFIGLGRPMLLIKHFRAAQTSAGAHNRSLLRASLYWVGIASAAILLLGGGLYIAAPCCRLLQCALSHGRIRRDLRVERGSAGLFPGPAEFLAGPGAARECLALAGGRQSCRRRSAGGGWTSRSAFWRSRSRCLFRIAVQVAVFLRQTRGAWTSSSAPALRARKRLWQREARSSGAYRVCGGGLYLETVLIGVVIGLEAAAFFSS
ncbi:MAG: hypothetical protein HPM95_21355 [Alphaproteobacteria bacterium]|nr:hypothetical protein [Alphaproteobacteria bacterium]MBL6432516.1 hypothetical protein [Alphaproteobacteria bacterium]